MLTLLSNDAAIISGFVTDTLVQLLPLLLTFTGAFVMMTLTDPFIAMLTVVLLPFYFLLMKLIGRRIRPISRAWIDAYSDLITFIDENLGMLPAVKAFTRERHEKQRFETHNAALLGLSRRQLFIQALLSPAVGPPSGPGHVAIAVAGHRSYGQR